MPLARGSLLIMWLILGNMWHTQLARLNLAQIFHQQRGFRTQIQARGQRWGIINFLRAWKVS